MNNVQDRFSCSCSLFGLDPTHTSRSSHVASRERLASIIHRRRTWLVKVELRLRLLLLELLLFEIQLLLRNLVVAQFVRVLVLVY